MHRTLLAVIIPLAALAQTRVDLQNQSKTVDFTAASFTRPVKTGSTLPATCSVGDLFFNTGSGAGTNLYGCVATNTWALQSGGGSGGGGGLGSGPCSTPPVSGGAVAPVFTSTSNCAAFSISGATTVTPTLPSGASGPFRYVITNVTPTASAITYAGASETGLCQPDASIANAVTTITLNVVGSTLYPESCVSATSASPAAGAILASNFPSGPPVAAVQSNIAALWTGTGCSTGTNVLQVNNTCTSAGAGSLPFHFFAGKQSAQAGTSANLTFTGFTTTVPANSLGDTGCLEFDIGVAHSTGTGGSDVSIWFGTTQISIGTGTVSAGNSYVFHGSWCNTGAANTQALILKGTQYWLDTSFASGNYIGGIYQTINGVTTPTAIDTTAAFTMKVTFNVAGTDQFTGYWFIADAHPTNP
jgi:hypothetical protein